MTNNTLRLKRQPTPPYVGTWHYDWESKEWVLMPLQKTNGKEQKEEQTRE